MPTPSTRRLLHPSLTVPAAGVAAYLAAPTAAWATAAWATAVRPHLHQFHDVSRVLLALAVAALLVSAVAGSMQLGRRLAQRLATDLSFLLAIAFAPLPLPLDERAAFNPAKPVLPFRFQRPPPHAI